MGFEYIEIYLIYPLAGALFYKPRLLALDGLYTNIDLDVRTAVNEVPTYSLALLVATSRFSSVELLLAKPISRLIEPF